MLPDLSTRLDSTYPCLALSASSQHLHVNEGSLFVESFSVVAFESNGELQIYSELNHASFLVVSLKKILDVGRKDGAKTMQKSATWSTAASKLISMGLMSSIVNPQSHTVLRVLESCRDLPPCQMYTNLMLCWIINQPKCVAIFQPCQSIYLSCWYDNFLVFSAVVE